MDTESERTVQEAIDKVVVGRTTIVIAHRLSTIKGANIIAVVKDSNVVEIGSHEKLMQEEDGVYSSLIRLQQVEMPKNVEECNSLQSPTSNKDFNESDNDCLLDESKSNNINFSKSSPASRTAQPSFWRLLALCKPEWKQASLGCFGAIILGAIQPLYAVAMGTTISVYFSTNRSEIKERIRYLALWFLLLSVLSFVMNVCKHYSFAYVGEYLTKRIREPMLSKILSFEIGWFDKEENSTGLACSILTKDANMVCIF